MKYSIILLLLASILPCQVTRYSPNTWFFATDDTVTETSTSPNNPFLDYYLVLEFDPPGSVLPSQYVPGYFVGNWDDSGITNSAHWGVTFCPDVAGTWTLRIYKFRKGSEINLNTVADRASVSGTSVTFGSTTLDGFTIGTFSVTDVAPIPGSAPTLLSHGKVEVDSTGQMRYNRNNDRFLKTGMNSPETFFAYKGFYLTKDYDNNFSPGYHYNTYSSYNSYWTSGNPDWTTDVFPNANGGTPTSQTNAGKNIIGLINYLNSNGANSVYFLPMNLGGDGGNCHPFQNTDPLTNSSWDDDAKRAYSTVRLNQWIETSKHMLRKNIFIDLVLAEEEDDNGEFLDDDNSTRIGVTRKLYLKQMVAIFGWHPGIRYILSEENSPQRSVSSCNGSDSWDFTTSELVTMGQYIKDCQNSERDPIITVHTNPVGTGLPNSCSDSDYGLEVYSEILNHSNYSSNPFLNSASLQIHYSSNISSIFSEIIESTQTIFDNASQPVSIHFDEVGPAANGINKWSYPIDARGAYLWEAFLSNAHLAAYLGGPGQDINFNSYSSFEEDIMECLKEIRDFRFEFDDYEFTLASNRLSNTVAATSANRSSIVGTFSNPTMATDNGVFYVIYYPVAFDSSNNQKFGTIQDLESTSGTEAWYFSLRNANNPATVIESGSFSQSTTSNKNLNDEISHSTNTSDDYVLILEKY